ncbi:MAG: hypothetical protein H8E54_02490 [Candidatus Aminicenantes bacterium]|nr:hypothetical protein [Candidatus Aminicenantes bacterium]
MKEIKYNPFLLLATFLLIFMLQAPAHSGTLQKKIGKDKSETTVIRSKTLEVNDKLKVITFTGDVNAKKGDFIVNCQKMLVYYESSSADEKTGDVETKINKIIAAGQVKINRAQGGMATAEKAVYYQQDEKMVLTGNPMVKQGKDFVEGDRIIMFLKENRSVVESLENKKVKAVIFQKTDKEK